MTPQNRVRLNFYITDIEGSMAQATKLVPIFAHARCNKPVSTPLGLTRLFQPSIMIEIEAAGVA